MRVLITGASGFLGQELATSFLTSPHSSPIDELILTDLSTPPYPDATTTSHTKVSLIPANLTSPGDIAALFAQPLDVVFLLHGIMSGASEANIELGLNVNLFATLNILNTLRKRPETSSPVKVIYASVLAAYGPSSLLPDPTQEISELTAPNPQSSYGTQKVMIESLINDFSRRNLIDGRILRLPTIMPRAGAPTGAASSFASDVIREPLNGRKAVLPVADKELKMFVCAPETIIANFNHAMTVPAESFAPYLSRTVIMPGVVVSVEDILLALVAVSPSGRDVLQFVEEKRDEAVEKIVASWPSKYNFMRALKLGFKKDMGLVVAVRSYYEGHIHGRQ